MPPTEKVTDMRVVSWNIGMSMDAYLAKHDRAWHFLVSLPPDIALVQEAIPPDWIRERYQVHTESFDLWESAVIVRKDWPMSPIHLSDASTGNAKQVSDIPRRGAGAAQGSGGSLRFHGHLGPDRLGLPTPLGQEIDFGIHSLGKLDPLRGLTYRELAHSMRDE